MDKDREVRLVADCRNGDRSAMEALVRNFEKPVYNAAFRILGNREDAADVTQATFLKLLENIRRFDPKYRLFSWIYRIAVNEAFDHLKRRKRPQTDVETEGVDTSEESAARTEACRDVQAALMELKDDYRIVIVLRYFGECSYDEIAGILDLPEKTVRSRLFSARQQIKIHLAARGVLP